MAVDKASNVLLGCWSHQTLAWAASSTCQFDSWGAGVVLTCPPLAAIKLPACLVMIAQGVPVVQSCSSWTRSASIMLCITGVVGRLFLANFCSLPRFITEDVLGRLTKGLFLSKK